MRDSPLHTPPAPCRALGLDTEPRRGGAAAAPGPPGGNPIGLGARLLHPKPPPKGLRIWGEQWGHLTSPKCCRSQPQITVGSAPCTHWGGFRAVLGGSAPTPKTLPDPTGEPEVPTQVWGAPKMLGGCCSEAGEQHQALRDPQDPPHIPAGDAAPSLGVLPRAPTP